MRNLSTTTRSADVNRLVARPASGKDRTFASFVLRHAESERISKEFTDRIGRFLLAQGVRLETVSFGLHPVGPRHGTFHLHLGSPADASRAAALLELSGHGREESADTASDHECEPMEVTGDPSNVVQFREEELDRIVSIIESLKALSRVAGSEAVHGCEKTAVAR